MELTDKIVDALQKPLDAEYIRLEDDDGISGFVVSGRFEKMSTLDRQRLIDEALRAPSASLSKEEQRQILMIAGLTPDEYESVGARIPVNRIRPFADGSIEILVRGNYSDANYVSSALKRLSGVKTTSPTQSPGATGVHMTFLAKGTQANPLTKEVAVNALSSDQYITLAHCKDLN